MTPEEKAEVAKLRYDFQRKKLKRRRKAAQKRYAELKKTLSSKKPSKASLSDRKRQPVDRRRSLYEIDLANQRYEERLRAERGQP